MRWFEGWIRSPEQLFRCWRDDDVEDLPIVNDPPEEIILDDDIDQVRDTAMDPGEPRPGDRDPAGISLRVTVSDISTITPYPAATDLDGTTPLYFGSAILDGAVIPGRVVDMRTCQVLQEDVVVERTIGFSVLPFDGTNMELVPTSRGAIPQGRRPVEGNYDEQGRKLYHAMLYVVGRQFPGMCAEHVVSASLVIVVSELDCDASFLAYVTIQGGAQGVFQGQKYVLETGYTMLWVPQPDRSDL